MLKYGSLNNISNQNSKTLLPRNLTFKSSLNTPIVNNTSNNNTSNNNTSNNDNLNVETISALSNTTNPYIVCNGAIAFSLLRYEYINHNFKTFPILFTRNILIDNKNVELNTESLTIKDNVIIINNQVKNIPFENSTSDVFISGFIFPIIDQNSSTGYYSGLLYLPNNKIEKVNSTSTNYMWTSNKYLLFKNINKGFFKLKYLSQDINFVSYQNTMTSDYIDLFDNNDNLLNLIVNSLGITDGELVAFNNEYLNIMLGDQQNVSINVVTFNKTNLTLKNNIDIIFDTSLTIKSLINYFKFTNNLSTIYTNLFFNKLNSNIIFTEKLLFSSNNQSFMLFDNINDRIEFNKNVIINTLIILNNLELNFKDLYFTSELNIGSLINNSFISYLNFTNSSTNKSLNLIIDSYANNLFINTNLTFKSTSTCTFENILNFNSSIGESYINLNSVDNIINFNKSVNVLDINVESSILLQNEIPIKVINNFSIIDSLTNILLIFNNLYAKFFYNIYINKYNPKIIFDNTSVIEISSLNPNVKLQVTQNNIIINGPFNNNSTKLNVIVGSSLNISNISCTYESGLNNFTFIPISKLYVLSGATKPTENITFVFQSVYSFANENTLQFSGKLNITSRAMDGNFINIYDINIWSTSNSTVEYNTLIPINTNLQGNWGISNFSLILIQPSNTGDYYNININCYGSPDYNIIWGIKLDGLSI